MRTAVPFAAVLLISIFLEAAPQKPKNPKTTPGNEFIKGLTFRDATVTSITKPGALVQFTGGKEQLLKWSAIKAFDQSSVGEKPLTFDKKPVLQEGDEIRIASVNGTFYVMRPATEEIPNDQDPSPEPTQVPRKQITYDDVKEAFLLDTEAKQLEFDTLDLAERMLVLEFAGRIIEGKDAEAFFHSKDGRFMIRSHSGLYDPEKLSEWLDRNAERQHVDKFLNFIKTPEKRRPAVKQQFGWLHEFESRLAIDCASKVGAGESGKLEEHERRFVRQHPKLFLKE